MPPSFEQRRDTVHELIVAGRLGCSFGSQDAKQKNILYCPGPASGENDDLERYAQDLRHFAASESGTLIVLPDHDAATFQEGREQAYQLNEWTFQACCISNRKAIAEMLGGTADSTLAGILRDMHARQATKEAEGLAWLRTEIGREVLRHKFVTEGPGQLELMHDSVRSLIAFVMGPYYKRITRLPHPRHSPHTLYVLNDMMEIVVAMGQAAAVEGIRRWQTAAVGYRYEQGFHLDQVPQPIDETKEAWGIQD